MFTTGQTLFWKAASKMCLLHSIGRRYQTRWSIRRTSDTDGSVTTFLENLEKSGNFFKTEKTGKVGKVMKTHDCVILSASITNSNFTSKSTQNAHICIEVFKKFPGVTPPGPLYWGMDTSPGPTPLTTSWFDLGARASAQSLQYVVLPFPTLPEKSGNFIWPGVVILRWETRAVS